MATRSKNLGTYLTELLENATRALPGITTKRMFSSNAFFTGGKIFALEWDDRIAVKLLEAADFDELLNVEGARPWSPNGKAPMSRWVLVPESFHDDDETLGLWVRRAQAHVHQASTKAKPTKAKPTKAKPKRKRAKEK